MSHTATAARGRRRRGVRRQPPGRAVVGEPRLLVAGHDVEVDAEPRRDAGSERVAVRHVAGRRRRDESHRVDLSATDLGGVVVEHANVRSSASAANTPVRSTSWPSRTISVARTTSTARCAVAVEVGDQQAKRVGPAVDRGDPGHVRSSWEPAAAAGTHGPASHQRGTASRASSPSGLTPGPAASACATSTCRHFTRVGMPPAETPSISSTCPYAPRSAR